MRCSAVLPGLDQAKEVVEEVGAEETVAGGKPDLVDMLAVADSLLVGKEQ